VYDIAGFAARGLGLVSDAASIVSAPTASSLAWLRARARDMPGLPLSRQANASERSTLPEGSPSSFDQPSTSPAGDESLGGDNDQPGMATAAQHSLAEGDGGGKVMLGTQGGVAEEGEGSDGVGMGLEGQEPPDGTAAADAARQMEGRNEPGGDDQVADEGISPGL